MVMLWVQLIPRVSSLQIGFLCYDCYTSIIRKYYIVYSYIVVVAIHQYTGEKGKSGETGKPIIAATSEE
jgi:hypothetical protein